MRSKCGLLAACALLGVSLAGAQVVPIGEFQGEVWETYESIGPLGGKPTPLMILNGEGIFDDTIAHYSMIANSLYSFPTDTYIYPYNGNMMIGAVTGYAAFAFFTPVTHFGTWFGTADVLEGGYVRIIDGDGTEIANFPFSSNVGQWQWLGWTSSVPMARIEIIGSATIGLPTVFDDTRIIVPEPAALGLLGVSALLFGRRR